MISTTQVRNGFRTALLPMVLSGDDASSKALWNSMMAVSAFHLSGIEAAFKYKTNAIRFLSASLSTPNSAGSADVNETQLAASMMLCIYNVCHDPMPCAVESSAASHNEIPSLIVFLGLR